MQASFKAEEGGIRDLGLERAAAREADGSNSRYDEPDAEGIRPFFRTISQELASFAVDVEISYRFSVAQRAVDGGAIDHQRQFQIEQQEQRPQALCHLVDH